MSKQTNTNVFYLLRKISIFTGYSFVSLY